MNKEELIEQIAEATDMTKVDVKKVVDSLTEITMSTVAGGDKVRITGFGNFEPRHRNARTGRNPQTGEELHIAERNVPAFKPGKAFKELVK